jgi:hypothetical protein
VLQEVREGRKDRTVRAQVKVIDGKAAELGLPRRGVNERAATTADKGLPRFRFDATEEA